MENEDPLVFIAAVVLAVCFVCVAFFVVVSVGFACRLVWFALLDWWQTR